MSLGGPPLYPSCGPVLLHPQARAIRLTPDEIRALLRECVTVVQPGEVLVLRARDDHTPAQIQEIREAMTAWLEENAPGIRVLVVPPMEIAVIPASEVIHDPVHPGS